MLKSLTRYVDQFRGSNEAAITLPPMDGALKPNTRIEDAPTLARADRPDNLVRHEGRVLFSSGRDLCALSGDGAPRTVWSASSPITFIAAHPSGGLAVGLEEGRVEIRGGPHDGLSLDTVGDTPIVAPSAACFDGAGRLQLCLASQIHAMGNWTRDLMTFGATGSVWTIELDDGSATPLARGLAFPSGIAAAADGAVVISESWRHRVRRIRQDGQSETLLDELPGYPSRLVREEGGEGYWLCVFAPRTQLIEFVLSEDSYRRQMIDTIDPEYWIAPSLHAPRSYLEPMQGGGLKQLGELKPWAPSRSVGLVARLDARGRPVDSFHSRANGQRHGVTSCLPDGDGLIVASKGGDVIVRIATREGQQDA